ncbi:hypothetical protein [Mucilaginibacter ginkgonis]|uniref:Uncharacterized protein n=1 Tax=Mucilaginibacter ginkgonis TaxID=2682091 RepID=A0A6I4IP02_9SPHI|nr:hypothetical protein [Mucilaginibacter ginkgonis]QQL50672.1 hypothetical protein GO620_004220 [Mucilaginibacter ginkgonis]
MSNYMISLPASTATATKKGTIHDPKSNLKVGAFKFTKSKFKPRKGEVQYFVTAGKKTFAFETEGFKKGHRQVLILEMIARFCVYIGLIGAKIHSSLPSFG